MRYLVSTLSPILAPFAPFNPRAHLLRTRLAFSDNEWWVRHPLVRQSIASHNIIMIRVPTFTRQSSMQGVL